MICSRLGASITLVASLIISTAVGTQSASADIAIQPAVASSSPAESLSNEVTFEETPVNPEAQQAAPLAKQDAHMSEQPPLEHEDVEPFRMVGVTWASGDDLGDVAVRVQVRSAGQWGEWVELDSELEPREEGRPGTDPLWLDEPADGVAVSVTSEYGTPRDVKVMTIDPGADGGMKPAVYRIPAENAVRSVADVATQPPIITRGQWGARRSASCEGTGSPTRGIVLHHTAGSNNYQRGDSAAIVRGIQTYHMSGQQWCDIGYNFLVDKYGQIFEGRDGSLSRQVRGAHAGIWAVNDASIGISMMGNYETANLTEPLRASVVRLTAWRLSRTGANPYGLYSAGGRSYNVIGAHREVTSTACPGRYGYAWLPNYRDRVAAAMANASPLVKAPGNPAIYLAMDNRRYHVPNTSELAVFIAGFGSIREVPASSINGLANGGTATRYVRNPQDGALYLLQSNGVRSWFPTHHMVNTYGYKLNDYMSMPAGILQHFRRGADVGPVFSSEGGKALYYVDGLKKRHLTTDEAWRDVNGGKATYAQMSAARAAKIPEGPKLYSARNTVRATNASRVYVPLTNSLVVHTPSFELAREFGARVDRVVDPSTLSPQAVVGDRLTPFVRCGSKNYVVADGVLHAVGSRTSTAGWTPTSMPSSACGSLRVSKSAVNDRMVFVKVAGQAPVYVLQGQKVHHVSSWASVLKLNGGAAPHILTWQGTTIHGIGWGAAIP